MTASLPDLAQRDAWVQQTLADAEIGHRTAARLINERLGENTTSEKSVRRYRTRRPVTEDLTSPYTPGTTQPTGSRVQWSPGIDFDPRQGGEFRTAPRPKVTPEFSVEPSEEDLLAEFDLDPQVWEVTSARKSTWQSPSGEWLEANKVSFRKRGLTPGQIDIDAIMSPYTRPEPRDLRVQHERLLMIPSGDLQLGKPEGGGTAATIERFCRITDDIAEHLVRGYFAKTALILPWLGDCIEGIVSQNGSLIAKLDISITEQVRVYRRLMMHQIGVLAPLAHKIIIPVVPGNHDETTRVQQMPMLDSWAIEGASAVSDWMEGRPEYAHVKFVFPSPGEPTITMDVGGPASPFTVSFIHGHTTGSNPAKVIDWWKGQAHGRQPAGLADMLVSAHYHHARIESTGGNKTWIQIPALDGGSSWYRHRTGEDAATGMLSVEITPGEGLGWRNLAVHT